MCRQATTRNSRSSLRSVSIATPMNIKGSLPTHRGAIDASNATRGRRSSRPVTHWPSTRSRAFPLTGGHEAVACNECHKPMSGTKVTPYHFARLDCTTCHEDVHQGQFAQRMAVRDAAGKALGCQACHSTREWKDLTRFDHAQTNFPLLGSHRAVACIDCHKPPAMELEHAACGLYENPRQLRRLSSESACRPVRRPCQRLRRMPQQQQMEAVALRS